MLICQAVAKGTLSADIPTKLKKVAKPKNYSSISKVPTTTPAIVQDNVATTFAQHSGASSLVDVLEIKKRPVEEAIFDTSVPQGDAADNADLTDANDPVILTVFGEPTPLSRHMVSRGHMYNPSAGLQKEFLNACLPFLPTVPLTGPLEATLYFYFSRPKNHFGTGKNAHILKPLTAGKWHCKRKGMFSLSKRNYFFNFSTVIFKLGSLSIM